MIINEIGNAIARQERVDASLKDRPTTEEQELLGQRAAEP